MSGRKKTELERNEIERNINGQKAKDARCIEMNKICQKADRMVDKRRLYLLSEEENFVKNLQEVIDFEVKKYFMNNNFTICVSCRRKKNSPKKALT